MMRSYKKEIYPLVINFLYEKWVKENVDEKLYKYISFTLFYPIIRKVYDPVRLPMYDDLFHKRGNK